MSIYVISDLHLSTNETTNKSMEKFGTKWRDYHKKLEKNFKAIVNDDDFIIIPGDISWAMTLDEAKSDFLFLNSLPGTKIIGKGNHDFWWSTAKKMNAFFEEKGFSTISILYNNAYIIEDRIICGTRGWFPDESRQITVGEVDHAKIVNREMVRLRLSLDAAKKLQESHESERGERLPITVFLHFPPVWGDFIMQEFIDAFREYGIKECYFGHIHSAYNQIGKFEHEGIKFTLTSSDFLNFHPIII